MTSHHHDHDGADDVAFDADDPDDYGHIPSPARRARPCAGSRGGQVTARFADGSLWLAYTGDGAGKDHPWPAADRTGVFDPQATEDYRPPTEHD
ncbi:hypothetical protein SAMN05216207_11452 [Pseudonocardia ammonioxydans]|uniref:Uncharacterized protein n=1 Tax=Pseudonocardia ammonioxydans TaxID=260086 RepID=A0A1I5IWV5_PSUAM|nr:hypothetical protein [Pseudonocardia ammonioxydans]SFO64883.1 hypothetical protein SAMN05216207_11452 [Pseudonocardia ammonioxydans]